MSPAIIPRGCLSLFDYVNCTTFLYPLHYAYRRYSTERKSTDMDVRDQIITLSLIALIVLLGILWNQKKRFNGFLCDLCEKEKPTSSLVCLPSMYPEEVEASKDPFWCEDCAQKFGLCVNAILNNDGSYQKISFPTAVPKHEPPAKT